MSTLFNGESAIVTGGGGAIGRATALAFAREGARVTVFDLHRDAAQETVALVEAAGGTAIAVVGDVASAADVVRMVEETVKRYGRLDCAFNNAGITHPEDGNWDEAVFRRIIDVNLVGTMLCIREQVPQMLKAGRGAIVNMSSVMGLISQMGPFLPGYTSSKHAVIGLTKAAALQYAKSGIRVNAVCPSVTRSKMVDDAMAMSEDIRRALENYAPLRGVAEPSEIAETVVWLCSARASFVTGHALVVDGGYTIQ
jgi:NAD(P)-dependent dehydrogenase (short-subunit alcohol dehydrogenase family)